MLGAWALGFGLTSGCLQPLDDVVARLALRDQDETAQLETAQLETTPDGSTPIVSAHDVATLFVGHGGFEVLDERRWIRHRVRPGENITAIAARHGAKTEDLIRWNRLDPNDPVVHRQHLRIFTARVAPELRKVSYRIGDDEDWDDLAAALRVPEHDLRVQNYRLRKPIVGEVVTAWIDPLEGPSFAAPAEPIDQPPLELHGIARSIGLPHKGKLDGGVQLPEHPLWVRGNPDHLWASAHAIDVTHQAFTVLRGEMGYDRGVLIGSISRRKGGKMAPHRSHQSGRDLDIRLPLRPGLGKTKAPTADEIDWYATWAMIEAYARTKQVEVVFLNEAHHGRLYAAARAMGVSRERVHDILRWPKWRGDADPLVQHADGHNAHLHVRVRCGSDEAKCESGP